MKTYIKYIITNFLKSFFYVFLIMLSLIFILNILTELEYFRNINVVSYFPIYISFLNTPSLIFEMFPFIFLISTQVFFINLFNNNQIEIFKYSGLKNSKILFVIASFSFFLGIIIITIFYNFSSNLKNIYLVLKSNYSSDDKYLAVITKNGLWIKDKIDGKINMINASKIKDEFLLDVFVTQFDNNHKIIRNIRAKKINVESNNWVAYDAKVFEGNISNTEINLVIRSNFDYQRIQNLFSNLSSLSILELFELRKNYNSLNYSTTEIDLQLLRVSSYPFYMMLMTIFSAIIMFNTKHFKSSTLKISIGLFASVIIYYVNNFFNVMGKTEKLSLTISIWLPILILLLINFILIQKINEK